MTWEEFLEIVEQYHLDERHSLIMSGVQHDNGFRGLMVYEKTKFEQPDIGPVGNPFSPKQITLSPNLWNFTINQDFVWTGGKFIRCGGHAGHPALAMTDSVYCAGRTIQGGFFFHSGHFKPKRKHGLSFFVAFVKACAESVHGNVRDQLVDHLCSQVWLQFYRPGTEGKVIEDPFTFCQEFGPKEETAHISSTSSTSSYSSEAFPRTSAMTIGSGGGLKIPRTQPMGIGSSSTAPVQRSAPISIGGQSPVITTTTPQLAPVIAKPKVDTSGESAYVKHINDSPTAHLTTNPVWIDDKEVTTCHMCPAKFSTFTRKHHCRQCGNIFCSKCCSEKKIVKYPSKNPSSKEDPSKPLLVCNACLRLNVLF